MTELGSNFSGNRVGLKPWDLDPLTNVIISDGIQVIEGYAFHSAQSISSIEVPASVLIIEEYAMGSSDKTIYVNLPSMPIGWHED